ncbi:hypothetical protein [Lachnotalea glycerini]|uniref:hypothetical protein n=1 Tax=Lachnotalea glycerini TaxID=1763509 RepID=UPI0011B803F0|nr:hypothetical protein [Lachnotalea glycerini]
MLDFDINCPPFRDKEIINEKQMPYHSEIMWEAVGKNSRVSWQAGTCRNPKWLKKGYLCKMEKIFEKGIGIKKKGKKIKWRCRCMFKDSKPQDFLLLKQTNPSIKSGDSNGKTLTKLSDGKGMQEIQP